MSLVGKPNNAQVVTPSNTANLPHPTTRLSFTDPTGGPGMGTVFVDMLGGQTNVGLIMPAGNYALGIGKVYATGTTATNIVAYWES